MPLNAILFRYLSLTFLRQLALCTVVLLGLIYIFDTIELIRRASGESGIGMDIILSLALYKLPDVGQEIMPFIFFFATIATLYDLTKRQELTCIRAAGVSVWQFIAPLVAVTVFLSLIYITVLHSLSAAALSRYEVLSTQYFGDSQRLVTVLNDGLWIRQKDDTGSFILKAKTLDTDQWMMGDAAIFFFDSSGRHLQRIDADTAFLRQNEWVFKNVTVGRADETPSVLPELTIATTLTADLIIDSFSDPRSLSFWQLPRFITALSATGFDTVEVRMHYQSLLALPLFLSAMILLAASLTLRTERTVTLTRIIAVTLVIGFLVFFTNGFLKALSLAGDIPLSFAAWLAPILLLSGAVWYLIHLEDG